MDMDKEGDLMWTLSTGKGLYQGNQLMQPTKDFTAVKVRKVKF